MVENAHKHLERDKGKKSHTQIIIDASKEVGPALFFSLLIITVSFLPVFSLTEQSGRMFKPLLHQVLRDDGRGSARRDRHPGN